ncbi:MAG: hypothetical protein JST26_04915 [Bacteroidetes bacterium]|nr:hypothetical protein [Bacteroidota bacterium]
MKRTFTTILAASLFLLSCGPSKEQIEAREKAKNDSIAEAAKAELLNQQMEAQAEADQAANQEVLKQQVIELKGQLAAAEAKLDDINGIKLLRTPEEKQQQIADQTVIIEELKKQIEDTQKQITE